MKLDKNFWIGFLLLFIIYYLNFYKLGLIVYNITCYYNIIIQYLESCEYTYYIFPWQGTDGQKSSSNIFWLLLHVISALGYLTYYLINKYLDSDNELRSGTGISKKIGIWLYRSFVFLIVINIYHFGEFNITKALMFNGIPLSISIIFYNIKETHQEYIGRNPFIKYADTIHFIATASPVFFEIYMKYF